MWHLWTARKQEQISQPSDSNHHDDDDDAIKARLSFRNQK